MKCYVQYALDSPGPKSAEKAQIIQNYFKLIHTVIQTTDVTATTT
jgi:hypothetical protein